MDSIYQRALNYGMAKYPSAHPSRHYSFAASVEELTCGKYKSDFGPTIRSHLVSWSVVGPKGVVSVTRTEQFVELTVIYPDGSLPPYGTWESEFALQHAEPIVYGALGKDARRVIEQEGYFDDDPADLQQLINQVKAELSLGIRDKDLLLDQLRQLKSKLS